MKKIYKIEVTFGSQYQKDIFGKNIEAMVEAYGSYILRANKGNSLTIKVSEKD